MSRPPAPAKKWVRPAPPISFTLHTATTSQQVNECLNKGENIEGYVEQDTPLICAIKRGNNQVIDALLQRGADPNKSFRHNKSPIQQAAHEDRVDIMQRLIEAGADINCNKNQETPLCIASDKGFVDVVDFLMANNALIELKDKRDKNALSAAAYRGNLDVLDRLLAAGANARFRNPFTDTSLLSVAAYNGHVGVLDRLVIHGAEVNAKNNQAESALGIASEKGHVQFVERLLDLGADINSQNSFGKTALMNACINERVEVIRLLLDRGADRDIRDNYDRQLSSFISSDLRDILSPLFPDLP
jgi:uncharacterized protein